MFLSRLNEINGGCEKILPVSLSFWSNLKFFKMKYFASRLWGSLSERKWNSLDLFLRDRFATLAVDQSVEQVVQSR